MLAIKCNNTEEFNKIFEHFIKLGYEKNFIFRPLPFDKKDDNLYVIIEIKDKKIYWRTNSLMKNEDYEYTDYKIFMRKLKINKIY